MSNDPLPYARQNIDQADIDAVVATLQSPFLTQGPAVAQLEKALCELTGARHCVAVANGTAALYLACRVLELGPGRTGATSPLSFAASANGIALCGGHPDFVDIDPHSLNMSVSRLESYLARQRSCSVVIPVDFAGVPARLFEIGELCKAHGISTIEDAAHSIGSSYYVNGERFACGSCSHTTMAIFSFHPVKTIATGEGGAVLTNDDSLAARLRRLREHGIERSAENFTGATNGKTWPYEMQELSFNFRMSDLHAALGVSQLQKLSKARETKSRLVTLYRSLLGPLVDKEMIQLQSVEDDADICYHLFPIQLKPRTGEGTLSRQELYDQLRSRNIFTQVHYWPIHLHPYYRKQYGYTTGLFPAAEKYARNCLSLPLFATMTEMDVHRVCDAVFEILGV